MSGLPVISGEFRLGGDPELRFTPAGKAVASFSAVTNKRVKNGDSWEDGPAQWYRFDAWERMAENIAESLQKGNLVTITGLLEQREYETREGEKRTSYDVHIQSIGPSLRWDSARVQQVQRQGGAQQPERQGQAGQENQDPWATPPPAADPWGRPSADEPPF